MSACASAPSRQPPPPPPQSPQSPQSLPPPLHTLSPLALGSAAALLSAVLLALWQRGLLGAAPLCAQLLATALLLCWLPYLLRTQLWRAVPRVLLLPAALAWTLAALLPASYALLLELFTGHRRAHSTWVDGVWRVYAILALWVLLAVFNERVIRPWWLANSDALLAPLRKHSVSAQAHSLAVGRREAVLDSIMQQMVAISKRKIVSSRTLRTKRSALQQNDADVQQLTRSVNEHKRQLQQHHAHDVAHKQQLLEQQQQLLQQQQQLMEQLQLAVQRGADLRHDVATLDKELLDCEHKLSALQHRWEQSLHIENHTRFYR